MNTIKDEAQRLAERFKSVTNKSEFARKFKVPGGSSMIYQHTKGLRPISYEAAVAYARGFNCSIRDISESLADRFDQANTIGSPIEAVKDNNPPTDAVQIRRVQFNVSAGISGAIIDQQEVAGNPIYFRQDWLAKKGWLKEKLVAVYVQGESMEPGLYAGDTVIINTADIEPHDGDVYVLRYEGETVIKRLQRDAGKWWLSSDNLDQRKFPRKECLDDICEIIGKVVYKQSERI